MLEDKQGLLSTFKNTFLRVPDTERKWYEIILWWEIRRIIYNFIVGLAGLIGVGIFFINCYFIRWSRG